MKVIRSFKHLSQSLSGHSWVDSRWFSRDLGSITFRYSRGKHVSSPDFRLPWNEVSQDGSSDHRHTLSACCSNLTDSSKKVSTRKTEGSVFSTFWRRCATRCLNVLKWSVASDHTASSLLNGFPKMVASWHWPVARRLSWSAMLPPSHANREGAMQTRDGAGN